MKYSRTFCIALVALLIGNMGCQHYTRVEEKSSKNSQELTEVTSTNSPTYLSLPDEHFTFIIANDLGKNGYKDQKIIAELMGETAAHTDAAFVAALGDVHHFMGIQSVNDPLWETNFEWIYKHPELMIPWYPVLGNHEYEGNTAAVLDYSTISRRWQMPARYYAKTFEAGEQSEALLVFIDTAPLIEKYRQSDDHPDARLQSAEAQLEWINRILKNSDAKWKIVLGHHPVFAGTTKAASERIDLQRSLLPILQKHEVDAYYCGHIHNFQHIRTDETGPDYFVNSSASSSRKVVSLEQSVFSSSETGFALCSISDSIMTTTFINQSGTVIYKFERR